MLAWCAATSPRRFITAPAPRFITVPPPPSGIAAPPTMWWFIKDYPGVLPPQLTADLSIRSIAEGWAASVATAASAPLVEELRRQQEDAERRVKQRRQEESAS